MVYRLILPKWLKGSSLPDVVEGEFTEEQVQEYNLDGYNCYFLPNSPSNYNPNKTVDALDIDTFMYVFVDLDMKDYKNQDARRTHNFATKESFIEKLSGTQFLPSAIIDSGNGIHAYWRVTDLDVMSFLRLQRRLATFFTSDPDVSKIYQLMRVPGTVNTKHEDGYKLCDLLLTNDVEYTCEELDKMLPPITAKDESFCTTHYDRTYNADKQAESVRDELPLKFMKLLKDSREVKELYAGEVDDRSKADYRLAHIMFAQGFTKDEAMSVLVNCRKALDRAPVHRFNYAANIADKVWTFEVQEATGDAPLSNSVRDILKRGTAAKGTRFPCWEVFDGTDYGFRLSHVLGLIGGAGSGKTTLTLNYFYHFVRFNPDYIHLFVSLEQPEEEIAGRWGRIASGQEYLHDKVHVLGNYNSDGTYRNLSLSDIQEYVLKLEKDTGTKVGCVVVDHIGVLKKVSKDGESQGLIDICHQMKAFAKATNTFLVMQSQTSRDKAGIGDVELNKDAAYGTSMFEWYCDFVVTTWQPLKRIYADSPDLTCSAFKYCKVRHKNVLLDKTKEDVVHVLMFSPDTELLSLMTEEQEQSYAFANNKATKLRNKDRKREPTRITRIEWNTQDDGQPTKTKNS